MRVKHRVQSFESLRVACLSHHVLQSAKPDLPESGTISSPSEVEQTIIPKCAYPQHPPTFTRLSLDTLFLPFLRILSFRAVLIISRWISFSSNDHFGVLSLRDTRLNYKLKLFLIVRLSIYLNDGIRNLIMLKISLRPSITRLSIICQACIQFVRVFYTLIF